MISPHPPTPLPLVSTSVPSARISAILRATLKADGDTSAREPTGSLPKRGEDEPSSVETGVGDGDRTRVKRDGREAGKLISVDRCGVDDIMTSCQPLRVF